MPDKVAFKQLLQQGAPVIMDGGFATQLEAQGCDLDNPLWSASVIATAPQQVIDAHRAYLDAGAQIIVSGGYQAMDSKLIAAATELALRARDEFVAANPQRPRPLVAASIGPYGATQNNGSEYTGRYDKTREELANFHRPRLQQLDASDVDVLACETVPTLDESYALCDLLVTARTPAWVGFCCRNGEQLSDGSTIEEAVRIFRNHPAVQAVGVNCTAPAHVAALIERIKTTLPDVPILVYPNSGETYDVSSRTWSGAATVDGWLAAADSWVTAGARIVGGCCRIGPEHIQALRQRFQ